MLEELVDSQGFAEVLQDFATLLRERASNDVANEDAIYAAVDTLEGVACDLDYLDLG